MRDSLSTALPKLVCVYKHLDRGGGVASLLLATLPRLREHFDIRMLCYRHAGDGAEILQDMGIPVDVFPLGSKWAPWTLARYVAYFRQHQPQVVHCHEYTANTVVVVAAALAGVPVRVRHLHSMAIWGWGSGARTWSRRVVDAWAGRRAQLTLAVSEAVRKVYLEGTGLPAETCQVLPNGVDFDRFAESDERDAALRVELGLPADALLVGIVGRLSRGKGHVQFLQACSRIAANVPEARFLVVGDGALRGELERLAEDFGVGDLVVFTGRHDNVPAVMRNLDLFLFTSMPDDRGRIQDGMPLVVLEAQAAGVPVVAFHLPMLPEILQDGVAGTIVPTGDVDALVEAAVELLHDPERRSAAGAAATRAARGYGWDVWVERVKALYEEFAGRSENAAAIPGRGVKWPR